MNLNNMEYHIGNMDHLRDKSGCYISLEDIKKLGDEELKNLIDKGYRYKHKSLEEYVAASGKSLLPSEEIDFGPAVGREVW